jgi:uncharacterized iron-regulated protein
MNDASEQVRTRQELIRLQKQIFRENQARILAAEETPPGLFRQYEAEYNEATREYRAVASFGDLVDACRQADIVYVADYHTLGQSQKTFLKILARMPKRWRRNAILGMEFVQGQFQGAIDRYLAGRITERTFLQRMDYRNHWPYEIWPNYKPIFDRASDEGLDVLAIECNHAECKTLHGRDSYAGWRITEALQADPSAKMMILIGELHVAPGHLPSIVQADLRKVGIEKRQLIVYQNCETIYWQLLEEGLSEVEVVEVADDAYCVINTPPIVQQQSYLNWIEYDEEAIEYGNLEANFRRLVRAVAHFFRIKLGDSLGELSVHGPGETEFLRKLETGGRYVEEQLSVLRGRVERSDSFYLPREKLIYLGRLTTNHAGEEATHFIKHVASGWDDVRPISDSFYSRLLHEALGFCGSKVLNHKRKVDHERRFHQDLARVRRGELPEEDLRAVLAASVVAHKRWERGISTRAFHTIYEQDEETLRSVTHALGYMLGEKLYYAVARGLVSRADVRDLFEQPFDSESEAAATYFHWTARVGKVRIPKRI